VYETLQVENDVLGFIYHYAANASLHIKKGAYLK